LITFAEEPLLTLEHFVRAVPGASTSIKGTETYD